ncbi:zinc finger protein swm-like [Contarinia nasturtii]|uniref:zinc finger protein swm-like n=1 Tax=Contarinia nasturtii TaxID=265458 RepID=UPI0012D3FF1B|nr:zinc finger protein swm-like [Contarinia nasturtii]
MASTSGDNMLYLSEIPPLHNTMLNLCNHFCKFGKILFVTAPYNGDSSAAAVIFEDSADAQNAFKSTDAVLNNRFIKMSLQSAGEEPSTLPPSSGQSDDTKCSLCAKTFASKWHRENHMKRIHTGTGINCHICKATFTSHNSYKKHCIVHHPNVRNGSGSASINMTKSITERLPKMDLTIVQKLQAKIETLKEKSLKTEKMQHKKIKSLLKKKRSLKRKLADFSKLLKEKQSIVSALETNLKTIKNKYKMLELKFEENGQHFDELQQKYEKVNQHYQNEQFKSDLLTEVITNMNLASSA